MLFPLANDFYGGYQQKRLLASYHNPIKEKENIQKQFLDLDQIFFNYSQENVSFVINENVIKNATALGVLKIPAIDATLPIVEGADEASLEFAAGHIPGTAMPGNIGNAAIAAHRSFKYGKLFNRLNEMAKGNEIIIETTHQSFIYKVKNSFLVLPEDVHVLAPSEDTSILTLITCHPMKNPTHRLIVQAELVNP
ncbi:class D sortase [Mesobacillus subterraneus]|nr:class D sortase [Mesobacillus subterraneus]